MAVVGVTDREFSFNCFISALVMSMQAEVIPKKRSVLFVPTSQFANMDVDRSLSRCFTKVERLSNRSFSSYSFSCR